MKHEGFLYCRVKFLVDKKYRNESVPKIIIINDTEKFFS